MPDYFELCDKCLEHVIAEARHDFCNQFCRPPFHSGGGTYSETPEYQGQLMEQAQNKHWNLGCCLTMNCKHEGQE